MGGLYILLTIATMGVTYGWQSDNNGGVEYIIQVSPEQLEQVRESGQITSAIDPAVQGHVSRIVVRVGNNPLPRITPPGLSVAKLQGDQAVVPVPMLIAGQSQTKVTLMKPDPQGGLDLPEAAAEGAGRLAKGAATGAQDLLRRMENLSLIHI